MRSSLRTIPEWLVHRAGERAPAAHRERLIEELTAELLACPHGIARWRFALGLLVGGFGSEPESSKDRATVDGRHDGLRYPLSPAKLAQIESYLARLPEDAHEDRRAALDDIATLKRATTRRWSSGK
jgi:hypothetical protein